MAKATHNERVLQTYGSQESGFNIEEQQFRVNAIRPGLSTLRIDGLIEGFEWIDDGGALTGSMALRKPDVDDQPITLRQGDSFDVELFWVNAWVPLWTMRIQKPPPLEIHDGSWAFELADDSTYLQGVEGDFHYAKSKRKPQGWLPHEIVRHACGKHNVPVGQLSATTRRIKNLNMDGKSLADLISRVYALERQATGRRFVIRWFDGRINVLPLQRNPILYVMRDQITQALVTGERRPEFCTALTGRASSKGKRQRKKLVHKSVSKVGVARYGYVHKAKRFTGIDSQGELVERTQRELARRMTPIPTIEITHRGIATVRRGHAIEIDLDEHGFDNQLVFVKSVTHTVSGGDYQMALTFASDDPLKQKRAKKKDEDKKSREDKSAQRKTSATPTSASTGGLEAP